ARPELGGLRHADPAVVDREDRLRALQLLRELLDDCCLLVSVHSICVVRLFSSPGQQSQQKGPHTGGPERTVTRPDDSRSPAPDFWTSGPAGGLGRLFEARRVGGRRRYPFFRHFFPALSLFLGL